jgi:hypothetical protein
MYSTNNSNSEQNYVYCRNDCGARIIFSENAISKNGRKISLQENGLPHNCPNSYFNKKRQDLQNNGNRFVKEEFEKIGHSALISSQIPDSPNRKLTQEQQLYVDTIAPILLEIHSSVQNIEQLLMQQLSAEKFGKRRTK